MLIGALQWLLLGGPTVGAGFGSQDPRVEATALVQVSDDGDSYWSYGGVREGRILDVL